MSLWRQRRAIGRAVAGQLSPADDAKLRTHLEGCVECRRYYDALTVQARILAGDPHSTAAASERELARLMAALNPAPASAEAPAWWPRLAAVAALAAAVGFGLISWRQSVGVAPAEQIGLRGGAASDAGEAFGVWVVTAPQDGGELRRDVAFPSEELARVRSDEWVAFAKQGGASVEQLRVVLVNEKGQAQLLKSGQSVALDPGRWKAYAIGDPDPTGADDQALLAAGRAAGIDGKFLKLRNRAGAPGFQASGMLIVR